MVRSELYLILPKYVDSTEDNSPYVDSYELMTDEDSHILIECIEKLDVFLSHENFQGYYDSKNVKAFVYPLEQMEDYYPSQRFYLRSVLKEWEDWRSESLQKDTDSFSFYCMSISDDSLCEITKRICINGDNTYLLLNQKAFKCSEPSIMVTYNNISNVIAQCGIDICAVSRWFEHNRRPCRIYNHNPKHGENGMGAFSGASPNLCSKAHSSLFLQKAIGILNKSDLYFYDEINKKYIVFKYENTPTNSYHAFHIDKSEVPKAVLTKISEVISH